MWSLPNSSLRSRYKHDWRGLVFRKRTIFTASSKTHLRSVDIFLVVSASRCKLLCGGTILAPSVLSPTHLDQSIPIETINAFQISNIGSWLSVKLLTEKSSCSCPLSTKRTKARRFAIYQMYGIKGILSNVFNHLLSFIFCHFLYSSLDCIIWKWNQIWPLLTPHITLTISFLAGTIKFSPIVWGFPSFAMSLQHDKMPLLLVVARERSFRSLFSALLLLRFVLIKLNGLGHIFAMFFLQVSSFVGFQRFIRQDLCAYNTELLLLVLRSHTCET